MNSLIYNDKNKLEKRITDKLLEDFKKKFIAADYDPHNQEISRLLWCNLSCETRMIPTENFQSISLDKNKKVYFYDERRNEMYGVLFSEICEYIDNSEPWEEIDAEIFDDSYEWFIAITHEDFSLLYGL